MLTEEMRNYVLDKVRSSSGVRKRLKAILLKDLDFSVNDIVDATLSIKDDQLKLRVVYVDENSKYQRSVFRYEPDTLYETIQPLLIEEDPRLMQKALNEAYKNLHEALNDSYDHVCCNRCDYIHNKLQAVNNQLWAIGRYLGLRPDEEPPKR